jgi:uncharacterized protein (DUF2236 family)
VPGFKIMPSFARRRLRRKVLAVLSHEGQSPDYDAPPGDPGLFGPDSVIWKIHADFPGMMAGGLAALMLQTLHPLALAGVWDHSDFRSDMLGRLRRTIAFVSRTTYAPRAPAEEAMQRILRVHRPVHGTTPDGRAYSADDPHLLNWVHAAESWCFLNAYETYCHRPIPVAMKDSYLAESALVAETLGARNVPKTWQDLDTFFRDIRGELAFDDRTREVLRVLYAIELPIPMAKLGRGLFFGAGAALLPGWALDMMQRPRGARLRDRTAARTLKLLAPSIRDAMAQGGLAWRSCLRTGKDYDSLFRWDD